MNFHHRATLGRWNGPAPSLQLGDYTLLEPLGEGGMGHVYLAEHRRSRVWVAIKVIAPHLAQLPAVARRFEAEARAAMRIDHPNVVRFEGFGREPDGTLYHVLELLDGVDLASVMERRGRFTAAEALPYVEQICAGLQAAHDQQVVHRDLKPENIHVLKRQPLTVKLLDFGIAKLLDPNELAELTTTGMVMGSPAYIAPEQARGEKDRIGPHSDIYSLGVILYTMLAGAPPFESDDIHGLLFSHISIPPVLIRAHDPSIPEPVARLVHRCLEKEPEDRPGSAAEVAAALAAAVHGEPATARYVTPRRERRAPPDEVQDTLFDPRYHQGTLHPSALEETLTDVQPAVEGPDRGVTPEPIDLRRDPTLTGRKMALGLALGLFLLGPGAIVALVLLAVRLLHG